MILVKAKKLSIHPLILDNIKGNSINLTACAHAWDIKKGNSILSKNQKN